MLVDILYFNSIRYSIISRPQYRSIDTIFDISRFVDILVRYRDISAITSIFSTVYLFLISRYFNIFVEFQRSRFEGFERVKTSSYREAFRQRGVQTEMRSDGEAFRG